jgi:AcrR family transcriptional regulator
MAEPATPQASPLRERQRELARETIIETVIDHIATTRSLEFSMATVASAAGVSLRTLYNYFGSREGLLAAAESWLDRAFAEGQIVDIPPSVDELPAVVRQNWLQFERFAAFMEAHARLDTAAQPMPGTSRRTEALARMIEERFPHLMPRQALAVTATIRQLMSSKMWYRYRREFELSAEEAADAGAWAIKELLAALDRGSSPLD